jgi:hypothetical protein
MVTDSNIDELGPGLSHLHQAVHGVNHDPAYWRWRHLSNPTGKTNSCVAVKAGQVVGNFSSIYLELFVEGKRVMAALNADLAVHPSERSWECLRGLLEMNMTKSLEDRVPFGFGFSTPLAEEINELLDGNNLGPAPMYLGFLNAANLLKGRSVPRAFSLIGKLAQPIVGLKVRNGDASAFDIRWVEGFGSEFDELWGAIQDNRSVAVIKDARYLNWRYVERPFARYGRLAAYREDKVEGLAVFYVGERRNAFFLELLARDDSPVTMRALLHRAFVELRMQGAGFIWASFPAHSQAASVLKELGFKSWGRRFWNMYMTVTTNRGKESCPELDAKSWDLSLGDWLLQ